jgi:two-component system, chemotaxis family, sensor kinase Cph1
MSSSSRKSKKAGEKGEYLTRSLRAIQNVDKLIMRAEEALQESEEHYSTLIGSLADAVFEFKGGVLVWCNDRVEEIYGYTRDELIGKGARFFFPEGIGASEFAQKISAAIKERGLFRGTARVKKKGGTLADIEYSISRTPTKDPIKVIVVARDITERKQAERERERLLIELAEKTRELEQIVYVASHDLRSPLVNIQGFTRELDESFKQVYEIFDSKAVPSAVRKKLAPLLDEDIPYAFQYILASSSKMDSLLSGLLRLSRLGRAALNIKQLDMNKLMAEVVASFEFQVKESGVKIRVEGLPPCYGDETQINQVFSNLLDNALKFLDADRPGMIRISGKEEEGRVTYCVEDNGIGIADKDREQIFEIFCRLDPDAGIGEGLGLTIVRKILNRHGGKVCVESEPGKGSRFLVSLPASVVCNEEVPITFGELRIG